MASPYENVESSAIKTLRELVLQVVIYKADSSRVASGSGFVLKVHETKSTVLTCEHVVRPFQTGDKLCVRRYLPAGVEELPATTIHQCKTSDVAILEVQGLTAVERMPFAHPEAVAVDQRCIAFGYINPQNLFTETCRAKIASSSPGVVENARDVRGKLSRTRSNTRVVTNCTGTKGMSGGPVLSQGGVIGMIASGSKSGLLSAVSTETILNVLKLRMGQNIMAATVEDLLPLID